jgi:PAS domain S-box-containing protein
MRPARDISDLKKAQDELSNSKEFLSRVINFVPDPLFVKDHEMRCIQANDALCRLFQLEKDAFLGKTNFELFPSSLAAQFTKNDQIAMTSEGVCDFERERSPCPTAH